MNEIEKKIKKQEITFAGMKGALSAIPIVGSFLSEALTVLLPNYRSERYNAYINILSAKLSNIDIQYLKNNIKMKIL